MVVPSASRAKTRKRIRAARRRIAEHERHEHVEPAAGAVVGRPADQLELARQRADDGIARVVEGHRAAGDVRPCAEAIAPRRIREQRDPVAAGLTFVGGERAADDRLRTEHREEVPGHRRPDEAHRLAAAAYDEVRIGVEGGNGSERAEVLAPVAKIGRRDGDRRVVRGRPLQSMTSRSGAAYGSGFSRTAS